MADPDDILRLYLAQENYPARVISRRLYSGSILVPSAKHLKEMDAILSRIPPDANLVVLTEHPGAQKRIDQAHEQAVKNGQILVLPLGRRAGENGAKTNTVAVLGMPAGPYLLDKLSLSVEDQDIEGMQRGRRLCIFDTPAARLAVLNCHDYTHTDLILKLAEAQVEVIIITTFNPAAELYTQYALADAHRLFCFVVLANIGNIGGSAVFGPFRRIGRRGPRKSWTRALSPGGRLFSAEGPSVARVELELPIGELRRAREIFGRSDQAVDELKEEFLHYDPIIPAESFRPPALRRYREALHNPKDIPLEDEGYQPRGNGKVRIAIAQLARMAEEDYYNNSYHISRSPAAVAFKNRLRLSLNSLGRSLGQQSLDFLVFPEVFLPLGLDKDVREFARRFNTIVIAGMEYEPQGEKGRHLYGTEQAQGKNRCFLWVPTTQGDVQRFEYTKLTRSQYDARTYDPTTKKRGSFPMDPGDSLLRLHHPDLGSFGVLICYDISHVEILWALNRHSTENPVDLLFVVASNPDGKLYRACCLADCHRFYQYIVLCNVANYGRSGVFGPIRSSGERQVMLDAGLGGEAILVTAEIDLEALRKARKASDKALDAQKQNRVFRKKPGMYQPTEEWNCMVCSAEGESPLPPGLLETRSVRRHGS